MQQETNRPAQWPMGILWGLVVVLLVLNVALLFILNQARLLAIDTLNEVEIKLNKLATEVIVYNIKLDQSVPVKADVPLNQTVNIPLDTVLPIDQVLTVPFQTPGGKIEIDMPIKTDFPINIVVPVDFNQSIRVDTAVQLDTTVPVEIDIARTSLASYLIQARQDVVRLRNYLTLQAEPVLSDLPVSDPLPVSELEEAAESPTQIQAAIVEEAPASEPNILVEPPVSSASLPENNLQPVDLGFCKHTYWPLQLNTAWSYNSPDSFYVQQVDQVLDNQVQLSTQYEGQGVQFNLECYEEGLGGAYLGDMRRITEFGDLQFSSIGGMFLPHPEQMEEIETIWSQELNVTGMVQAHQGSEVIAGEIEQGHATATYRSINFEMMETPLGQREVLRIEQKLNLSLAINFELDDRTVPVTEKIDLTTVYWFARGIGPVKMHWQGGTIQRDIQIDDATVIQQISVPALAEEQLVSVCIQLEDESSECLWTSGISEEDLTAPSDSELAIETFVLPDLADLQGNIIDETDVAGTSGAAEPSSGSSNNDSDDNRLLLLAYAETIAGLAEEINQAGNKFGAAAMNYRDGALALGEFQTEFETFKSGVESPMNKVNQLSPPSPAAAVHQKFVAGLEQCDQAIGLMDQWFDHQDSGIKETTILLVASCLDQVSNAEEELRELIQ